MSEQNSEPVLAFKTISGDFYYLPLSKLNQLKEEFHNKDVDGVLSTMRSKLEHGDYSYNKRGMMNAIRNWLTRAPARREKQTNTVRPEHSSHPALRAQRERDSLPAGPAPKYKDPEEVQTLLHGLQKELSAIPLPAQQEIKRYKVYECKHPDAHLSYFGKWFWCPECGTYREQYLCPTDVLVDLLRRRISQRDYESYCCANETYYTHGRNR